MKHLKINEKAASINSMVLAGRNTYTGTTNGLPVEYGHGSLTVSIPRRGTMTRRTGFNPKHMVSSGNSRPEIGYRSLFADCIPDRDAVYDATQVQNSMMGLPASYRLPL